MSIRLMALIFTPIAIISAFHFFFVRYPGMKKEMWDARNFDERDGHTWRFMIAVMRSFAIIMAAIVLIGLAIFHGDSK